MIFQPKLFTLLKKGISKEQILKDITAGSIVGIVALPLAIAFAVASGVSPEKGIITAIVAGFIISIFGGSRVQIGGPTGAFIIILYGIIQQYGIDGLLISTLMAGVILIIFGFLKLGNLLKYFPHPLIVGFTSGIAVVIFSTQVKDALGLNIDKLPADFFEKWQLYFGHMNNINFYALAITIITIIITVNFKKINSKIPGSFIALFLLTLVVQLFHLPVTTIETFFGSIPSDITFSLPHFELSDLRTYIVPALVIALLGSVESLLSAVVSDGMIGGSSSLQYRTHSTRFSKYYDTILWWYSCHRSYCKNGYQCRKWRENTNIRYNTLTYTSFNYAIFHELCKTHTYVSSCRNLNSCSI